MIRTAASMIALSLLVLPACGDDDDDNDNVIEEIPTNYVGLYRTDCIANGVLDLTHTLRTVEIQADGGFSRTEEYFGSQACADEQKALKLRVDGTVQEKGDLPENPQLDMLNFSVSDVFITVNNEALRGTLNTTSFCGITDWALGQEREVSGANCRGFTIKKGDVIQEVVDDREGTLYFGNNFALLLNRTDDRPTAIDEKIPYHKK